MIRKWKEVAMNNENEPPARRFFFLGGGGGGGGGSSHVSQPGDMNIHIAHAQYACYRTLYSSVIADSFVKYREKENK